MQTDVRLTSQQRDELLQIYRKDADPEIRFRAHIILLLADGYPWSAIEAMLFCSSRTINRWRERFEQEGVGGLAGRKRGRPFRLGPGRVAIAVTWVTRHAPSEFGFLRSRWACETLVLLLRQVHGLDVSRETVRRWLHAGDLVYRRPRPEVGPTDPEREQRLARLRKLLAELPEDETVVRQDEVEVHTNPKIGRMWMFKGRQAVVTTRGPTASATSPGRSTGGPARSSSPRRPPSEGATLPCSSPTWTTCAGGCVATARSTSFATTPGATPA